MYVSIRMRYVLSHHHKRYVCRPVTQSVPHTHPHTATGVRRYTRPLPFNRLGVHDTSHPPSVSSFSTLQHPTSHHSFPAHPHRDIYSQSLTLRYRTKPTREILKKPTSNRHKLFGRRSPTVSSNVNNVDVRINDKNVDSKKVIELNNTNDLNDGDLPPTGISTSSTTSSTSSTATAHNDKSVSPVDDNDPADSYVYQHVYGDGVNEHDIDEYELYRQKCMEYWIAAGGKVLDNGMIEFRGELPDDVDEDDTNPSSTSSSAISSTGSDDPDAFLAEQTRVIGHGHAGELYNKKNLVLRETDLLEKFQRGGGRGGQKVNKTNNCVLLIHEPTNTRVKCHATRSLSQNRIIARNWMKEKLELLLLGDDAPKKKVIEKERKRKAKMRKRAKEKHRNNMHNTNNSIMINDDDIDMDSAASHVNRAYKDIGVAEEDEDDDFDVNTFDIDVTEYALNNEDTSATASSKFNHAASSSPSPTGAVSSSMSQKSYTTSALSFHASDFIKPIDKRLAKELEHVVIPSAQQSRYLVKSLEALTEFKASQLRNDNPATTMTTNSLNPRK